MKRFFALLSAVMLMMGNVSKAQTTDTTKLTNLVVFVRFADDEGIDHPFSAIDSMFNSREPGYLSVYNFYQALSYGKIQFNTVYTNNIHDGIIVSYVDTMPRSYFQPYSESNPIGYHPEEKPSQGVSMREAELLGRIVSYVNSMHLVDSTVVLDGNGDGDIDNISFIAKGGTGEWNTILWPHMEYFPHDSLGCVLTINGVAPNAFNFEFEGAEEDLFCTHVFRHEMGHSLGLPDLYHYTNYDNVTPAFLWDMMNYSQRTNHTSAILKNKILHVADDPIEITSDGDYTLQSVGTSPSQNCYYIKSAIDSTQWYVFEYRNQEDLFEDGIPGTGLLVARWNDTVTLDNSSSYSNAFFDFYNIAHLYWIFRPGSDIDTVTGSIRNAHFSLASGRTAFGPTTDPHPYLTDGTPETSFEITDIRENGTELTFHVHFLSTQGIDNPETDNVKVCARDGRIIVDGAHGEAVQVYDIMGRQLTSFATHLSPVALPTGVYMVKIGDRPACKVVVLN